LTAITYLLTYLLNNNNDNNNNNKTICNVPQYVHKVVEQNTLHVLELS